MAAERLSGTRRSSKSRPQCQLAERLQHRVTCLCTSFDLAPAAAPQLHDLSHVALHSIVRLLYPCDMHYVCYAKQLACINSEPLRLIIWRLTAVNKQAWPKLTDEFKTRMPHNHIHTVFAHLWPSWRLGPLAGPGNLNAFKHSSILCLLQQAELYIRLCHQPLKGLR